MNENKWIWQRRAILAVVFVVTAAWRYLRPDCILPGVEVIIDAAFLSRYPAFVVASLLLYLIDIALNLRREGYSYTRLSQIADVAAIIVIGYQTFFAPPTEWY